MFALGCGAVVNYDQKAFPVSLSLARPHLLNVVAEDLALGAQPGAGFS